MKPIFVCLLLVLLLGGIATFGLPQMRSRAWKETLVSRQAGAESVEPAGSEAEIEASMKVDDSQYDVKFDIRKIRSVPNNPVALEAAFRQRSPDVCESLEDGEPLDFAEHTVFLTARDRYRTKEIQFPSTRREVATIGLNMLPTDQRKLPLLSRPLILDFLGNHYLSLQARILKDATTGQWMLHYRPIAAVGKFSGLPFSQKWVEAVSSTVQEIRGLGIFESKDKDEGQSAVIVFRSTWLDEKGEKAGIRHELVFIHAIPSTNSKSIDPFEIHLFVTSNQRTVLNHFSTQPRKRPRGVNDCDLQGTVRFDEFMRGGLQPKSSVTRKMLARPLATFRLSDVDDYLNKQGYEGGWCENLTQAFHGILKGHVPRQAE